MKRIIKNNYQPNSVRMICPICKSVFEFDPKFDLETEEFQVYIGMEKFISSDRLVAHVARGCLEQRVRILII